MEMLQARLKNELKFKGGGHGVGLQAVVLGNREIYAITVDDLEQVVYKRPNGTLFSSEEMEPFCRVLARTVSDHLNEEGRYGIHNGAIVRGYNWSFGERVDSKTLMRIEERARELLGA